MDEEDEEEDEEEGEIMEAIEIRVVGRAQGEVP